VCDLGSGACVCGSTVAPGATACAPGQICSNGQCETTSDGMTSTGPPPPPDMAHVTDKPGKVDMAVVTDMASPPDACAPLVCGDLPPSPAGVSRCAAAIYNRRTQATVSDQCGGLLNCGDCCHTSSACLVGHCTRTECACPTSGTLGSCTGSWLGSNCCQFTLAKACTTAADCP
jgi:hypothetical protein